MAIQNGNAGGTNADCTVKRAAENSQEKITEEKPKICPVRGGRCHLHCTRLSDLLITNPRNRLSMIGPADFCLLNPCLGPIIKAPSEEKPEAYETYIEYDYLGMLH